MVFDALRFARASDPVWLLALWSNRSDRTMIQLVIIGCQATESLVLTSCLDFVINEVGLFITKLSGDRYPLSNDFLLSVSLPTRR